ncbi:hypothetical protein LshimejAT787_2500420 [Lyophyllum shimeji]|uniref:Uncharacterized protein n=1 Tax=Lyophyllum shimeji TaxID=47721 RepID=A0A9P3Q105_LYOSH|nr:hypothetical protein LshimejAT787_2500420 [Lyophyllum shimeji]
MYGGNPASQDALHPSLEPLVRYGSQLANHPAQSGHHGFNNFQLPPHPPPAAHDAPEFGNLDDDDDLPSPSVAFGVVEGPGLFPGYSAHSHAHHSMQDFIRDPPSLYHGSGWTGERRDGYVMGLAPQDVGSCYLGRPSHSSVADVVTTTSKHCTSAVPPLPIAAAVPHAPKPNPAVVPTPFKAAAARTADRLSQLPKTKQFTANDLTQLARVCCDLDVFSAPRGKIGATWEEVGKRICALDINHSTEVLRKKAELLLQWHDDPGSVSKSLQNILKGNDGIPVSALLDKLAARKRQCVNKTDAERVKLREKAELEKKAGDAIRKASMGTRRAPHISDDSGDDADVEIIEVSSDIEIIQPVKVLDDTLNVPPDTKVKREPKDVKLPKPVAIKKEEADENMPIHASMSNKRKREPTLTLKTPAKKKTKSSSASGSDTTPSTTTRRTKREKKPSFDLEVYLNEEREKRERFQDQLLHEVRQGNEVYAQSLNDNRKFQADFLSLLREKF